MDGADLRCAEDAPMSLSKVFNHLLEGYMQQLPQQAA